MMQSDIVKNLEMISKEMSTENRNILAYQLYSTFNKAMLSNFNKYIYSIFNKVNNYYFIDTDTINHSINNIMSTYSKSNTQPFYYSMLLLLISMKYMSVEDRIKLIFLRYHYDANDFDSDRYEKMFNDFYVDDEKELSELKEKKNFIDILEEKDKVLQDMTDNGLLYEFPFL